MHQLTMRTLSLLALWVMAESLQAKPDFLLSVDAHELGSVAINREEWENSDLMWVVRGKASIMGSGRGTTPASLALTIPADGPYSLWVCYQVHEIRRKTFSVLLDGREHIFGALPYGASGASPEDRPKVYQGREANARNLIWTRETADLKAGDYTLKLNARPTPQEGRWKAQAHPPVVRAIVITNDPDYLPPDDLSL